MDKYREFEAFVNASQSEAESLLEQIGRIPAPSHKEDKRAAFIREWLVTHGARNVYIDSAKNVVFMMAAKESKETVAFLAHTDVVFEDEDPLPLYTEGRKVFCPGIGDDTANLVNLLMTIKYLLIHDLKPKCNLLFVANSCEEGLGNLEGCKKIMEYYGDAISEFISFDGYLGQCCYRAVGSCRYKITVRSMGGHSYLDYGRDNAIYIMANLVKSLYEIEMPTEYRTTCNVGHIEGGTTVNSIAAECSILYEFRSEGQICIEKMSERFKSVISEYSNKYDISVELLGLRAGSGAIDEDKLRKFTDRNKQIIQHYFDGELNEEAYSTDSNVPLSRGIPANTIGTVLGGMAHTREEWADLDSMNIGMKIVMGLVSEYIRERE